jgi:hypothetical protein
MAVPREVQKPQALTRAQELDARLGSLKHARRRFERRAFLAFGLAALFVLFAAPGVGFSMQNAAAGLLMAAYGLVFAIIGLLMRVRLRSICQEIVDILNELDLLELVHDPREQRATKLLQVNQIDLKRYYEQALRQGSQIFYVGLVCILFGFGVIGIVIWLIQGDRLPELSDKIVVAALGAVSGVLANFIALIYLKMFSQTAESVSRFHGRLVERDRLNFANVLAAKIEAAEAREETLGRMAVDLALSRDGAQPAAGDAAV